jgi:hypothetical protein
MKTSGNDVYYASKLIGTNEVVGSGSFEVVGLGVTWFNRHIKITQNRKNTS